MDTAAFYLKTKSSSQFLLSPCISLSVLPCTGDTKRPMLSLVISSTPNVFLNLFLVTVFRWRSHRLIHLSSPAQGSLYGFYMANGGASDRICKLRSGVPLPLKSSMKRRFHSVCCSVKCYCSWLPFSVLDLQGKPNLLNKIMERQFLLLVQLLFRWW